MNSEVKYRWPLNSEGLGRPTLQIRKWACNFWLPQNVPTVLRSMGDSIQGPRRYQNPGMLTCPEGNGVDLYLQSALLIHGFPTTIENTFPSGIDGIWRCKLGCGRLAVCVLAKSLMYEWTHKIQTRAQGSAAYDSSRRKAAVHGPWLLSGCLFLLREVISANLLHRLIEMSVIIYDVI